MDGRPLRWRCIVRCVGGPWDGIMRHRPCRPGRGPRTTNMPAAVHILCGPARAGKTQRMLERFRARLADCPRKRPLAGADRARGRGPARPACSKKRPPSAVPALHTFQEVLEEIVRANDPAARPLTAVQRRLLAEDVVAELTDGGRPAALRRRRRHARLHRRRSRSADGPPAQRHSARRLRREVRRRRRQGTAVRPALRPLPRRIATAEPARRGRRRRPRLRPAAQGLRRPFAEVRAVFVDGFSDFTRPQHEFLELLCEWVEELWIALPGENDDRRRDLFARPRGTLERLATACGRRWNG